MRSMLLNMTFMKKLYLGGRNSIFLSIYVTLSMTFIKYMSKVFQLQRKKLNAYRMSKVYRFPPYPCAS